VSTSQCFPEDGRMTETCRKDIIDKEEYIIEIAILWWYILIKHPRVIFILNSSLQTYVVESSWNVMAHGDAREGKWRGNWRMELVASTLRTISEHGVSSITTADAHTSAAGSRLNWRPRRFKWTRPFRRKTKSGFCACAITFETQSTYSAQFTFSRHPHTTYL